MDSTCKPPDHCHVQVSTVNWTRPFSCGALILKVITPSMVVLGVDLCCAMLETNLVQSVYLFTGLESVKFFYITDAMYLKVLWPKYDATKFNTMMARTSLYCELDQILFMWSAYTESDNAPARKIGSGYARLYCVDYLFLYLLCISA